MHRMNFFPFTFLTKLIITNKSNKTVCHISNICLSSCQKNTGKLICRELGYKNANYFVITYVYNKEKQKGVSETNSKTSKKYSRPSSRGHRE